MTSQVQFESAGCWILDTGQVESEWAAEDLEQSLDRWISAGKVQKDVTS